VATAGLVFGWLSGVGPAVPPAAAEKRIAVLEIEGARSGALYDTLVELVDDGCDVVPGRTYQRTARRIRAHKLAPDQVSRVASALDLDGVLQGMVVAENDHYVFRLRLRAGADGRTVRRFTMRMSRPRLKRDIARRLGERLTRAIAKLPTLGQVEDDFDRAFGVGSRADDDFAEEAPRPAKRAAVRDDFREDDEPDGEAPPDRGVMRERDDFDDDDPNDAPMKTTRRTAAPTTRAIAVAAGVSALSRSLVFVTREGLGDAAPQDYQGVRAPGVLVRGELYPLARSGAGVMANLGVGFVVDRALELELVYSDAMNVRLPVSQARYGVDARYRHRFGAAATGPELVARVGYGKLSYLIDKSAAPEGFVVDIPNVAYTYFDPGLALRVPLTGAIALWAEGRFLLVTDAGEVVLAEQYGAATILGADADVAVEIRATPHIAVTLGGRYLTIGYAFKGAGDLTVMRDGDAATVDVGGAKDTYVGGYATASYSF
jgi:hypothetical protein